MTTALQPAPPQKRSRWSFSLLTLFLATGLIMAVISHVRTSRLLENYREKSDELEIESPRRIYVRRMHHSNPNVRRWRVFLPEGQFFLLNVATKGAGGSKLPAPEQRRRFDAYGEVIVDVFAADMINGTAFDNVFVVTIMKESPGGGSVTTTAFRADVPGSNFLLACDETATGRTLSFAASEPVVLFRGTNASPPSGPNAPPAEPGIILWITPDDPSE